MIVGICGEKQNGKDTVGNMIIDKYPNLYCFALATRIKNIIRMAICTFNKHDKESEKETLHDFYITKHGLRKGIWYNLREYLEEHNIDLDTVTDKLWSMLFDSGSATTYDSDLDGFSMRLETSWRSLMQLVGTEWGRDVLGDDVWISYIPDDDVIVTDIRRDNEAQAVINRGGIIVNVNDPRKSSGDTHISEAGISADLITTYIVNDSTLEHLEGVVSNFLKAYEEMKCK